MPKAFSKDLREKVVDAYTRGVGSIKQVAQIFGISIRSVKKYLKIFKETGDLTPGKATGRPPKVDTEGEKVIKNIVKIYPDKTLNEYCSIFESKTGIKIGKSIMDRAFSKLNINRKKKLLRTRATAR